MDETRQNYIRWSIAWDQEFAWRRKKDYDRAHPWYALQRYLSARGPEVYVWERDALELFRTATETMAVA